MKKQIIYGLSILMIIISATSCTNCDKSKVTKIDSLITNLDHVQSKIETLKIDSISQICSQLKKEMDIVVNLYPPQKDLPEFMLINNYYKANRGLEKLSKKEGKLIKEIETSKSQFETLKKDIKNGAWTKDSIDYFYQSEVKIFNQIMYQSGEFLTFSYIDIASMDTLYPQLNHFIDSMAQAEHIDLKR